MGCGVLLLRPRIEPGLSFLHSLHFESVNVCVCVLRVVVVVVVSSTHFYEHRIGVTSRGAPTLNTHARVNTRAVLLLGAAG